MGDWFNERVCRMHLILICDATTVRERLGRRRESISICGIMNEYEVLLVVLSREGDKWHRVR